MTVNLIVFNPSETSVKLDKNNPVRFSDYRRIGDAVSEALDKWKEKFQFINVRFLPFCFLKKHPECVKGQWQKFHEDQEWDPVLNVGYREGGFLKAVGAAILGCGIFTNHPKYRSADLQTFIAKRMSIFRMRFQYRQNAICRKKCSLSPICTGIQRDFVEKFGFPEVDPVVIDGGKVTDPLYYEKGQARIYQSLRGL